MALEIFEVGVATELPDGKYTKGQAHAVGSRYNELQGFLPRHDSRYKYAVVKDGLVIGVEIEDQAVAAEAQVPAVAAASAPTEPAAAVEKPKKPIFFGKK